MPMSKASALNVFKSLVTSRRTRRVVRVEKRKSDRKSNQEVTVHLIDDDGTQVPFDSFDLSAGGIHLRSEFLLYPGDEVILQIEIPGSHAPLLVVAGDDDECSPSLTVCTVGAHGSWREGSRARVRV